MKTMLVLCVLTLGLAAACAPNPSHDASKDRIQTIDNSGDTTVYRDTKTGCQFLNSKAGYGESMVLIPGTCGT
jgi:hypothetical protein